MCTGPLISILYTEENQSHSKIVSTIVEMVRIANSALVAAFIIKGNVHQNTDIFFYPLKFTNSINSL